jgi:hypothetical protein
MGAFAALTLTTWVGAQAHRQVFRSNPDMGTALSFGLIALGFAVLLAHHLEVHVALPVALVSLLALAGARLQPNARTVGLGRLPECPFNEPPDRHDFNYIMIVLATSMIAISRAHAVLLGLSIIFGLLVWARHARVRAMEVVAIATMVVVAARSRGRVLPGLNDDQVWDIANAVGFAEFGTSASIAQADVPYSYFKFGHLWLGWMYSIIGVEPVIEGLSLTLILVSTLCSLILPSAVSIPRPSVLRIVALVALFVGVSIPGNYVLDRRHTILVATLLTVAFLSVVKHLLRTTGVAHLLTASAFGFAIAGARAPYALVALGGLAIAIPGDQRRRALLHATSFGSGVALAIGVFFRGVWDGSAPLPNLTSWPDPLASASTLFFASPWRLLALLVVAWWSRTRSTARDLWTPYVGAAITVVFTWVFLPRHVTQYDLVWLGILLAGLAVDRRFATSLDTVNVGPENRFHISLFIMSTCVTAALSILRRLTQFPNEFPYVRSIRALFRPFQPESFGTRIDLPTAFAGTAVVVLALASVGAVARWGSSNRLLTRSIALTAGLCIGSALGFGAVGPIGNLLMHQPLLGSRDSELALLLEVERGSTALALLRQSADENDVIATSIHDWDTRDPSGDGLASIAYLTRLRVYIEAPAYGSPAGERIKRGASADTDSVVAAWLDRIHFSTSLKSDLSVVSSRDARSRGISWVIRRPQPLTRPTEGFDLLGRDDYFEVWRVVATNS